MPLSVVTAYSAISAEFLAPLGGYDVARLPGSHLALRLGRPGVDRFEPLGGRPADMPVTERVVYACDGQWCRHGWDKWSTNPATPGGRETVPPFIRFTPKP